MKARTGRESLRFHSLRMLLCVTWLLVPRCCAGQTVLQVPEEIRSQFELDAFYVKYINVGGLPIVGSKNVSDAALKEAAWIVTHLVGHRDDILRAMAENKTRLAVMAYNEYTTDVPEHTHLSFEAVFWNRRARGLGATLQAPAVSCGEENLLGHPNDPYWNENICIHEFAHAIHGMGMITVDPTFETRLEETYEKAIKLGLWKDTYAATNHYEYWAEATQSWFDDNRENDSLHNHVDTRDELKEYDPHVARLCEQVYGDREWRYQKPKEREADGRVHLSEVDFDNLPAFEWKKEPLGDVSKVTVDTPQGSFDFELASKQVPIISQLFLDDIHQGLFSSGEIHRHTINSESAMATLALPEAERVRSRFLATSQLETAADTGLVPVDGALILICDSARTESDQYPIFICLGDQPDFAIGGKENPDGKSYVVIGKVTEGLDIVKAALATDADEENESVPKMIVQRMVRKN